MGVGLLRDGAAADYRYSALGQFSEPVAGTREALGQGHAWAPLQQLSGLRHVTKVALHLSLRVRMRHLANASGVGVNQQRKVANACFGSRRQVQRVPGGRVHRRLDSAAG